MSGQRLHVPGFFVGLVGGEGGVVGGLRPRHGPSPEQPFDPDTAGCFSFQDRPLYPTTVIDRFRCLLTRSLAKRQ